MTRLPTIGGDYGSWGQVLTDYLNVTHNSDGTLTGRLGSTTYAGISGTTAAMRWVGGTVGGAPTGGTFTANDFAVDLTGSTWVCSSGGTPGTWKTSAIPSVSLTLLAPFDPRLIKDSGLIPTTSGGIGTRVIVPKTGVLGGIALYIQATSGNIDVGVYDTSAGTRNLLYHSGSIVSPGSNWREVATPNLSVTSGQQLDLAVSTDNGTFALFGYTGTNAGAAPPTGYWPSPGGANNMLAWTASSVFPLPSTLSEASLTTSSKTPAIIGRIT